MTDEPTFVLPFHGVEDFPPESAPLAVKSAQATLNGLIDPVMFGLPEHHGHTQPCVSAVQRDRAERCIQ